MCCKTKRRHGTSFIDGALHLYGFVTVDRGRYECSVSEDHLTLDRNKSHAISVLCGPGLFHGSFPPLFRLVHRFAQEHVYKPVD